MLWILRRCWIILKSDVFVNILFDIKHISGYLTTLFWISIDFAGFGTGPVLSGLSCSQMLGNVELVSMVTDGLLNEPQKKKAAAFKLTWEWTEPGRTRTEIVWTFSISAASLGSKFTFTWILLFLVFLLFLERNSDQLVSSELKCRFIFLFWYFN